MVIHRQVWCCEFKAKDGACQGVKRDERHCISMQRLSYYDVCDRVGLPEAKRFPPHAADAKPDHDIDHAHQRAELPPDAQLNYRLP
jgi:hypothetical protein